MSWQRQVVAPTKPPPKVDIRNPSPGLCRFFGSLGFLIVGLGLHQTGSQLIGVDPWDIDAPWTTARLAIVIGAMLAGFIAGLLSFAYAMAIKVDNPVLNDFFTWVWHFLSNGMLLWVLIVGCMMSAIMGVEEAKAAVRALGLERATTYVLGEGALLGAVLGISFFVGAVTRMPFILWFAAAVSLGLVVARVHFSSYGVESWAWWIPGVLYPPFLVAVARNMIARDRAQLGIIREQS